MKAPATFTDEEAQLIVKALNVAITAAIDFGGHCTDESFQLIGLRAKLFEQLHGTEATDVGGEQLSLTGYEPEKSKPFDLGAGAYRNGICATECPFGERPEREKWLQGWDHESKQKRVAK